MSSFRQDVKYAVRTLVRSPGFTFVALLSLGLGIGANTAIFTLTNAVFLHGLPVKEPSRVIELYQVDHATKTTAANLVRTGLSYPNFVDYRGQSDVFTGVSGFFQVGATLTGFGKPQQQAVMLVTANYFEVLGVQPVAGRTFFADEDRKPGGNTVAVLSFSLAQRLFGGPAPALGHSINLSSTAYTVIGVAPPEFKGTFTIGSPELAWVPLSMHSQIFTGPLEAFFNQRRFRFLAAFGRLKPGVTEQQALTALKTIASRLEAAYPKDNHGRTVETAPLTDAALGFLPRDQTTGAALALTAAVGFVLLIACANIANLTLARATKRAKELGVRTALGAPRSRLIRQLMTESVLLALAGGVVGMAFGWGGARLLWAFRPPFMQQGAIDLRLDLRVVLFTAAISLLTGVIFGIAPAFRASVPDVARILNAEGRGNIQGGTRNVFRSGLVVAEIALSMIALAGAGLFVRSMQRLQQVDPGFETQNLITFAFDVSSQKMPPDRGRQFMRDATAKINATPGVAASAVAGAAPMTGGIMRTAMREGDSNDSHSNILAFTNPVSPGYFDTVRIPLIEGRAFNAFDKNGANHVAIVNEAMARHFWPGQPALGKRFVFANSNYTFEVVGVAKNSVITQIGERPQVAVYVPVDQEYQPAVIVHVRTTTSPQTVMPSVLAAVQSLNPDLSLRNPLTIRDLMGNALWAPRMGASLFATFGLLAMLLAAVGVYGVMAYIVMQRTNEIGIRMALGANPGSVLRMVVSQSLQLAGIGIAVGVVVSLALTRLLNNLLYEVAPNDPLTFSAVTGILALTALLAGSIPAWRAARIDPLLALRQE